MFSGGAGSWATAKLVRSQHPDDPMFLVFADTLIEDDDLYRFLPEAAENIGAELVWLKDGRDVWQVFHDDRFLGNSRLANCSKFLKQKPSRQWLETNCPPDDCVVYVGIDWTETHRLPAIQKAYLPYRAEAPLTEPPYLTKEQVLQWMQSEGLTPPRLYRYGFAHNNCGGFCVRSGQAQFRRLFEVFPERYRHHEQMEEGIRQHLGKDVSILRDRSNGSTTPLTLRSFRQRISNQESLVDPDDWGGCGCFVDSPDEEASA